MPKLPLSPMKVYSAVSEVREQSEGSARLIVAGSDEQAMNSVRDTLTLGADQWHAGSLLDLRIVEEGGRLDLAAMDGGDAVVILVASPAEVSTPPFSEKLSAAAQAGAPVVAVLTSAPGIEISFPGVGAERVVGMAPGGIVPADVLAEAVVAAAGDAAVALAAKLPILRDEATRNIIRRTARQNAVVGALFFIPGTDMPVMTLNEARMILRIAAIHGEPVGADRALEILGVVGTGFGLRAVARQLLNFLPGPGWAIKGGVAWTGTRAIGETARKYFNGPVRVTPERLAPLVDKLKQLRG